MAMAVSDCCRLPFYFSMDDMNDLALETLMDMLASSMVEDMDRKILSALGLMNLDERNKIATVKLHNGRGISIYHDAEAFIFKYFNRRNDRTIAIHEANDILDGVEYFLSVLEPMDSEILWNWFLGYGK